MKRTPKLFAQAYKGYVEIVSAHRPPVVSKSRVTIKSRLPWFPYNTTSRKMTVVSFNGGDSVIKTMPRSMFARRTGHNLQTGVVWALPKDLIERVLR
jgi:hypothetical protein